MFQLNSDFRSQKCPAESYLIDMRWYKQWEAFVRGKAGEYSIFESVSFAPSNKLFVHLEPPGPIDNCAIQPRSGRYSASGLHSCLASPQLLLCKLLICLDYDVGQISAETWKYLVSIYGGGPELVHRNDGSVSPSVQS